MTEEEARAWIDDRFGSPATDRLAELGALVAAENEHQNLVSRSSLDAMWVRHLLDSVQLAPLAKAEGVWLDIGTGAGFPGLAVACVREAPVVLVEPRAKRADFLVRAAASLRLDHVSVHACKAEQLTGTYEIISARAVASLDQLFAITAPLTHPATQLIFPRGRNARNELADARRGWRGMFHVEQSQSEADAAIILATQVYRP